MEEEGNVTRCVDCGHTAPTYGEGGEDGGADDMG